jgi:hypothetical protein
LENRVLRKIFGSRDKVTRGVEKTACRGAL